MTETTIAILKSCYPDVDVASSFPFPNDPVYTVERDGRTVAFLQVHATAPRLSPAGSGRYIYNLCVLPEYRGQGVGTELLAKVEGPVLLHAPGEQAWLERRGWTRGDTAAGNNVEYSRDAVPTPHYDARRNVLYLQPQAAFQ